MTSFEIESKDHDLFMDFVKFKKEIIKVMNKYSFEELVYYVYAINSFFPNKQFYQVSCLLNSALAECKTTNHYKKSYERLCNFFSELFSVISNSRFVINEDSVINDCGECSLNFDKERYSFILGTGYNNTYGIVRSISLFNQDKEITKSVLNYHSEMIDKLYSNRYDNINEFTIPSIEYYKIICDYIDDLSIPVFIQDNFVYKKDYGFKSHVIVKDDKIYPLFNVSILVDYYAYLVSKNDLSVREMINDRLLENFSFVEFNERILFYPCRIIDKIMKEKVDYVFVSQTRNGGIFCLEENECADCVLENEIKLLNECNEKAPLNYVETIRRNEKGSLGITLMDNDFVMLSVRKIISPYISMGFFGPDSNHAFSIGFTDLITLIDFANMDEMYDFFKSFSEFRGIMMPNMDILSIFNIWKSNHGVMFQGTMNLGSLMLENNMGDAYVYDCFTKMMGFYPFKSKDYKFINPFSWDMDYEGHMIHRANNIIGGTLNKISDSKYSFYYFNVEKLVKLMSTPFGKHTAKYVDDYMAMLIEQYGKYLDTLPYNLFEFMYSPLDQPERNKYKKIGEYFYIKETVSNESIHFLFDVDLEKLQNDLKEPKDCSVEIETFMEFMSCIKKENYVEFTRIRKNIESDRLSLPHMKTILFESRYWFDNSSFYVIGDESFIEARKRISQLLYEKKISNNTFSYKEAALVEEIFCYLYGNLISELIKFGKNEMRVILLDEVSNYIATRDLEIQRIKDNDGLANNKSLDISYESKTKMDEFIRDFIFLIDINESVNRDSIEKPSRKDIGYFIAYARWISILKTQSLALEFKDESIKLTIDYENLPQIEESKRMIEMDNVKSERQKKYIGYSIKHNELDKKYFLMLLEAFEQDTSFKLGDLWDLIEFISRGEIEEKLIASNVVKCTKNDLVQILVKNNFELEIIEKILDYLIIDEKNITVADKKYDYVPFHNRTGRRDTIQFRPLIRTEDDYIMYSPALLYNLSTMFKNGFLDFFPPYKVGLEKTLEVIDEWKREYEHSIEQDLCFELRNLNFDYVCNSVVISKLDVSAHHPSDLGDYDVIAIDGTKRILYLIECKVLSKCGSYFETNRQQFGFFYKDKYDEKFQKRIDYAVNNLDKVLKSFGVDDRNNYTVKSIMVTNKNFVSLYKSVNFDIMMYDEFIEKMKNKL